jgi:hypothetical protein
MCIAISAPDPEPRPSIEKALGVLRALEESISFSSAERARQIAADLPSLRQTISMCAETLGAATEDLKTEDLLKMDGDLIAFLDGSVGHQSAAQAACDRNKFLGYAKEQGYSHETGALHDAWRPVKSAFHGDSRGCGTFINRMIQDKKKYPWQLDENDVLEWKQWLKGKDRLPTTIEITAATLRTKVRQGHLDYLFPLLDLTVKVPDRYIATLEELETTAQADILGCVGWKEADYVPGRPASLQIRKTSAKKLLKTLLRICGFAKHYLGMEKIASLRQVLIEPVIQAFVDWLLSKRKCKPAGILSSLGSVCALTKHHPLFKGDDYEWFYKILRRIPKERKSRLTARKDEKCVPYDVLALVAIRIRTIRENSPEATPVDVAWMVHDELFMTWFLHLPWRSHSVRTCGLGWPAAVNILEEEIPYDMRHVLEYEPWAREALDSDPHHKFLQFCFTGKQAKGRRAVRDLLPSALIALFKEYRDVHRPGTLFLNRRKKAMSEDDIHGLFVKLTSLHIDQKVPPHLARDIFSENFLANGGKIDRLRRLLWHNSYKATWIYCKRFNMSQGAIALDAHFSARDLGRMGSTLN